MATLVLAAWHISKVLCDVAPIAGLSQGAVLAMGLILWLLWYILLLPGLGMRPCLRALLLPGIRVLPRVTMLPCIRAAACIKPSLLSLSTWPRLAALGFRMLVPGII